MRCRACLRTTPPSQAKHFSGFDFCKTCYDALGLANLKKKELKEYFLSVSNEGNAHLFEALVTVASTFDKKEGESLLSKLAQIMDEKGTGAEKILAFLLAAKALSESEGTHPLTKVGELALLNMSGRLTAELIKGDKVLYSLSEDASEYDVFRTHIGQFKKDYSVCADVINSMEPSAYTDQIREHLNQFQSTCDLLLSMQDVDLSGFGEGVLIECNEILTEILSDELGEEHTFHGWEELKNAFTSFEEDFFNEGIRLVMPEEVAYDADIFLFVGEGEIYLTAAWETLQDSISSEDYAQFAAVQKGIPLFVLEKAAGGTAPLCQFVEKSLPENPENVDLMLLYATLLGEMEKTEEAASFLEKKIRDIPDERTLHAHFAALMDTTSQPERAVKLFEEIVERTRESWAVYVLIGQLCETMKEFKKAAASYQKALELNPQEGSLASALSRTQTAAVISEIEELLSQEEYERALTLVDADVDPFEITIFYYYKGVVLSRMGNSREALTFMTDYLDVFPEDEEGWFEKAGMYLDLGQVMRAAQCFRRWSKLNPYDVTPLVWEALCYKRLGRTRSYKRCINQAKRIDPEGTKALLKRLAS